MRRFDVLVKRITIPALLFTLIATGLSCAQKGTGEVYADNPQSSVSPDAPLILDHTTFDYDNRFSALNLQLAETEDAYLWLPKLTEEHYLRYYDKTAGDTGVLCAKPECTHNSESCNAYIIPFSGPSLCMMDGLVYWVNYYHTSGSSSFAAVFCCNPDSTERRIVSSIEYPPEFAPQRFYFHRNKLFAYGITSIVASGSPTVKLSIMYGDITTGKLKTLLETEMPSVMPTYNVQFVGSKLYAFFALLDDEPEHRKIFRADIETGDVEEIMSACSEFQFPLGFYVNDEHIVFAGPLGDDAAVNVLYSLKAGSFETYMDFSDRDDLFFVRPLRDIVVGMTAFEEGGCKVWVRDYEGNTVYRGFLETNFLTGSLYNYIVCGDRNNIIVEFNCKNNGKKTATLVAYDLSDLRLSALSYKIMGFSEEAEGLS